MSEDRAVVFVVDDDPSMRRSLDTLLRSVGHEVRLFSLARPVMLNSMLGLRVAVVGLTGQAPALRQAVVHEFDLRTTP
jgi:hypothetical protein